MMGFIYPWIRTLTWIDHDPVTEIIYHGGDA